MPARQINLLPKDDFEKKPIGKFLNWALNVGRWIVIFTELLVIMAFLSRFKLDADLADLHDQIKEKQAIIQASSSFEKTFRLAQERTNNLSQLINSQAKSDLLIEEISKATPIEIVIRKIGYSGITGQIQIFGNSSSENGLKIFTARLSKSSVVKNIVVEKIDKTTDVSGLNFTISVATAI